MFQTVLTRQQEGGTRYTAELLRRHDFYEWDRSLERPLIVQEHSTGVEYPSSIAYAACNFMQSSFCGFS